MTKDSSQFDNVLSLFRGLSAELQKYPKRVQRDIEKYQIDSNTVYYPCDIVELRKVLSENKVFNPKKVCFFSLGFAKKYLQSYPVLIGIKMDSEKLDICDAIASTEFNHFDLEDSVKRIYVNNHLSECQIIDINNIVSDERPELNLDIFNLEVVPAIAKPVLAKAFNFRKFSQMNTTIQLTDLEQNIFGFLTNAKNAIPQARNVEMRVAGGWVRDKLLGEQSDDIDIAISSMSGIEFAELLQQYAASNGIEGVSKGYAVSLEKSSEPTEEDANPDLMVGGIKIFGQKVEFVPMRTETYTADSRQPIIQRTDDVHDDVVRRDLTVNALYYNVETGQVEDYVNGLQDLQTMTLKTPLSPEKTFQDDPLRMLRVLRFYSRFQDATIDPSVLAALKDPKVQAFYGPPKLAPERASTEFVKMMAGAKPAEAARILFETGLYKKVLNIGDELHDIDMDQQTPHHIHTVMDHILSVLENVNNISKEIGSDDQQRGWLNLAAFFHDFGKLDPDIQKPHPKREGVMQYIGHDSKSKDIALEKMTTMGFDKDVKKFVTTVVEHHMFPFMLNKPGMKDKSRNKHLGKFLNKVGDFYESIVHHQHADQLGKGKLSTEKIEELQLQKQNFLDMMGQYRQEVGPGITTTFIDGNRIREILTETVPEIINNNVFFNVKGKMVHHLAFAKNKLLIAQWERGVSTPEEAEMFVRNNAKNWLNVWKQQQQQQQQQQNPQASNWFKRVKTADASSVPTDIGLPEALEVDVDIPFVGDGAISPFQIGDRVRLRTGGWGAGQTEGRVSDVKNNAMQIEIETGKHKGNTIDVDLLDTARLSMTWEKIH